MSEYIALSTALEIAHAEHGLEWFESGAAYEFKTEYESLSDHEVLDWMYGKSWDIITTDFYHAITGTGPRPSSLDEEDMLDWFADMAEAVQDHNAIAWGVTHFLYGTNEEIDALFV